MVLIGAVEAKVEMLKDTKAAVAVVVAVEGGIQVKTEAGVAVGVAVGRKEVRVKGVEVGVEEVEVGASAEC